MKSLGLNLQSSIKCQNHCENTTIRNPFLRKRPIIINVADTHNVFAYGLFSIIKEHPTVKVASFNVTTNFQQIVRWGIRNPDCLQIVNPNLLGAPGLESIKILRGIAPQSTIVMLIDNEDDGLADFFLKYGANAVISKQAELSEFEDLFECFSDKTNKFCADNLTSVQNDSVEFFEKLNNLTDRQMIVLELLKDGKLNKQIAQQLKVAEVTIKHHISKLLNLFGFFSRSQLVGMLHTLQFEMQKPKCYGIHRLKDVAESQDVRLRTVREYARYSYSLS